MTTMASQITSHTVVFSTVYSDADQRTHQNSASLAFVWGIPAQRASYAENVSICWRLHAIDASLMYFVTGNKHVCLSWSRHMERLGKHLSLYSCVARLLFYKINDGLSSKMKVFDCLCIFFGGVIIVCICNNLKHVLNEPFMNIFIDTLLKLDRSVSLLWVDKILRC